MDKNLKTFEKNIDQLELPLIARLRADLADELREQPELNTEFHLRRFLHARENDYNRTFKMLKACLAFRKAKNLTRIASMDMNTDRMKTFKDYYTAGHYGVDNQGRLIIIDRVGFYDYKGLAREYTIDELEDYIVQLQERILFIEYPIISEMFQRRCDRCLVILDLKNLNLKDLFEARFRKFINTAMTVTSNYYPEMMGKSVFVNAPLGTKFTWSVIKLGLDAKTANKFEICSDNGRKYLSQILDFDQLPLEIGGKNAVSLSHGYGPFMDEIKKSYARKSLFLADREVEYKWFYTEEERAGLPKEVTKSTMASGIDQPRMNKSDVRISASVNQSVLNKSGVSRRINISEVRVSKYFGSRHG